MRIFCISSYILLFFFFFFKLKTVYEMPISDWSSDVCSSDRAQTIVASALVYSGSAIDKVIDEEFKGTGNSDIHLDRRITEKRVYPAINVNQSGTRREDLLIEPELLQKIWILRKLLHTKDETAAMEFLLEKMKRKKSNDELFD